MKKDNFFLILLLLFSILILKSWFLGKVINSGDFRFFWPENISTFAHIPSAWDASLNTGVGMPEMNTLWLTSYLNFTVTFSHFGLSWNVISLFFWIIPFLLISFFSSFFLWRFLINKNNWFTVLAGIIYTTNTYFLSIFFGGQVGVCFAYAFIPLVVLFFLKLLADTTLYRSLLFALVFSLQFLFDPRFSFLTLLILGLYYLLRFKVSVKEVVYIAIIPGLTTVLLHAFWILPTILFRENTLEQFGSAFSSLQSVKFFSFATFENSLSLLHPNWPENIFGKVYFMKPEFLVMPILAFSSLLFLSSKFKVQNAKLTILFFALLGLIGAFLAKGANDPLGQVYLWMFAHVPGFVLFRDSTKFYVFISLAYSILIPFSLFQLTNFINSKFKVQNAKLQFKVQKYLSFIIFLIVIFYWLFSLRLLVTTNFWKSSTVPESYVQLKDFVVSQQHFFRTLWIPQWQRYGYFSNMNPAIGRGELFKEASASGMIKALNKKGSEENLQDLGVKYIIVPEDSKGEIFLDDRKYSEKEYLKTVSGVEKIPWLTKVTTFGKIVVLEVSNAHDRFWNDTTGQNIPFTMMSATQYVLTTNNAKKGERIIFSDRYDPYWIMESSKFKVQSSKFWVDTNHRITTNSFVLPEDGSYTLNVYYQPQKWVETGLWVSGAALFLLIGSLVVLRLKTKK